MINRWRYAKLSEQTHTADAQDDLLNDPRFLIAAVKMAGNKPVDLGVVGQIGIEQIELYAANLGKPRLTTDFPAADVDENPEALTTCAEDRSECKLGSENIEVNLFL